ncbi:flagellar assembly protein FliW [Caldichromatium japonicum]|uniref:Flagellar assembly factor FliW n=1 Tax=Caldichromatium japonicum TaxID=2699430 RepID=A0A6G7VB00_9GAMM|nr:flagellar assembly protein FliW [Caldichromatium japonicum]QIK36967.1 flagellar assembly protein FliW [Caldichromatium japonicum]
MNQQTAATPELASPTTIVFPEGIPGFEHLKTYRLTYSDTEGGRIYRLRPEDDPEIEFTLVDPQFYALNYVLALDDTEQSLLQAEHPEEILVLLMLWKDTEGTAGGLHANIAGPILINVAKGLGMQKIIGNPRMELSISNA